ncbi:hypothetical protein E2562_028401 [Oryza meyeriana var. granulata]|uniref:Uncharacterized protein n=1 Tax=Oryza meyeriana var. granulata TaxID=110450 RepID=A0A6G1E327_9ORYZ|nr:hypothetical protein E2562_028401 [Oryza meyeriana var. granulata]
MHRRWGPLVYGPGQGVASSNRHYGAAVLRQRAARPRGHRQSPEVTRRLVGATAIGGHTAAHGGEGEIGSEAPEREKGTTESGKLN